MKALFALERISTKEWQPKHVLMHGDLWLGNILLKKNPNILNTLKPYDNFVVTDWAGSEVKGYAMYDLIRFAESTNLSSKKIKFEIERHCKLLNCNPVDACSYLLAGLGFIGMNLENFPLNRFISMSESCFLTLSKSLDSRINGLSFDWLFTFDIHLVFSSPLIRLSLELLIWLVIFCLKCALPSNIALLVASRIWA